MRSLLKYFIWGVVAVGAYRGYVNYTGESNTDAASTAFHLVNTAVDTVADLTYRWIPTVVDFVSGVASNDGDSQSVNSTGLMPRSTSW